MEGLKGQNKKWACHLIPGPGVEQPCLKRQHSTQDGHRLQTQMDPCIQVLVLPFTVCETLTAPPPISTDPILLIHRVSCLRITHNV